MSSNHDFYLARAAEARADADAATLSNVKERCLRSEAAWMSMATRAERSDKARARLIVEKAQAAAVIEETILLRSN